MHTLLSFFTHSLESPRSTSSVRCQDNRSALFFQIDVSVALGDLTPSLSPRRSIPDPSLSKKPITYAKSFDVRGIPHMPTEQQAAQVWAPCSTPRCSLVHPLPRRLPLLINCCVRTVTVRASKPMFVAVFASKPITVCACSNVATPVILAFLCHVLASKIGVARSVSVLS